MSEVLPDSDVTFVVYEPLSSPTQPLPPRDLCREGSQGWVYWQTRDGIDTAQEGETLSFPTELTDIGLIVDLTHRHDFGELRLISKWQELDK